jgi:DNA repair exonuclease SbcCD nuclease subunit
MRFAHISDTHLGYRQYNLDEREGDFYQAFHEAVDKIIEERCDFVLHCGDLFEEPRPPIRAMLEVQSALDRLDKAGIDYYAITGNHDRMVRKGSYPPHSLFKRMKLLSINEPFVDRDGILICGLPYIPRSYANVLRDKLSELAEKAKGHEKSILMLHQGVDKYIGFESAYELKIGDIPRGFDYIAMGHIHLRRIDEFNDGKLAYPGSTEVWRIDELEDYRENGKGFFIVDTKRFEVQKVDIECIRPHFSEEVNEEADIKKIEMSISKVRMPILHLDVVTRSSEYGAIYQKLTEKFRDKVLYLDLKRKQLDEELAFEDKGTSVGELIKEAMHNIGRTDAEISFVHELFKFLSDKDIEKAVKVAEDFYATWDKDKPSGPTPTVGKEENAYKLKEGGRAKGEQLTMQSDLEAFR